MAPALTQTAEPPNLAHATVHTPHDSDSTDHLPYESLKEPDPIIDSVIIPSKKYFEAERGRYFSNGVCGGNGLAPPAFGWAVGRPVPSIVSPCRSNMDERPPNLPLNDSGNNTCINSSNDDHTHQETNLDSTASEAEAGQEQPAVSPASAEVMGIQSCLENVDAASEPLDLKGFEAAPTPAPTPTPSLTNHEDSGPILNNQNELLSLVGRDFDYMTDFIETLQRLLEMEQQHESGGVGVAPSASVCHTPEDRAAFANSRLSERQRALESRRIFILRRLRRVTARGLGMTVSSQFGHLTRHVRRILDLERAKRAEKDSKFRHADEEPVLSLDMLHKESMKAMSTSDLISLVRRVEASNNNLQRLNDAFAKREEAKQPPLLLSSDLCAELDTVATEMRAAALSHLAHDSDATESSSGGESCDEAEGFLPSTNYKPIRERAFYRYCRRRGWIASRWMWLQAQIADLDYKIQQQKVRLAHIQKSKGAVQLAEESFLLKSRNPALLEMQDPALTCIGSATTPRTVLNGFHPSNTTKLDETNTLNAFAPSGGPDCASAPSTRGCARTIGVEKVKRRRYVRPCVAILKRSLGGTSNSTNNKFIKVSSVICKCVPPLTCIVCVKPRIPGARNKVNISGNRLLSVGKASHFALVNQSVPEKIAKVDQGFHPVLSRPEEMLQGELYNTVLKIVDWQRKAVVSRPHPAKDVSSAAAHFSSFHQMEPLAKRRKRDREHKRNGRRRQAKDEAKERLTLMHGRRSLTEDEGEEGDDELSSLLVSVGGSVGGSTYSSPCPSPALPKEETRSDKDPKTYSEAKTARKQSVSGRQKQNSTSSSYDINNIVIPYSMAATSRVELLQYKEIPTPKWRVEEITPLPLSSRSQLEEEEDVSEEAVTSRHSRSEEMERRKFHYLQSQVNSSRSSRSRRADSSGTNTPDHPLSPRPFEPMEAATPVGSPPDTPLLLGPMEDSSQSSHTSTKSTNQSTVLTLSLSSLQSSLLKSNPHPSTNESLVESEENGVSCVNCSSQRLQKNAASAPHFVSDCGGLGVRTRRMFIAGSQTEKMRQTALNEDGSEKGRVSPFPCRQFPLNENEFEDLVSENERLSSPTPSNAFIRSRLKGEVSSSDASVGQFASHQGMELEEDEEADAIVDSDVESGRASPLSELTDSAPEDMGTWDDGTPPDWTISAVNDEGGGLVLTVQRN